MTRSRGRVVETKLETERMASMVEMVSSRLVNEVAKWEALSK